MNKLLLGVLLLGSTLFAEDMSAKVKKQNLQIVQMAAKEISNQLPQIVDKYTKLVKIEGKDESLLYTFEINTGSKSDETVIKEDRSRMKKAVINGICSSSARFIQSGIDISYIYTSAKSKKELFRFDVSRKDCMK